MPDEMMGQEQGQTGMLNQFYQVPEPKFGAQQIFKILAGLLTGALAGSKMKNKSMSMLPLLMAGMSGIKNQIDQETEYKTKNREAQLKLSVDKGLVSRLVEQGYTPEEAETHVYAKRAGIPIDLPKKKTPEEIAAEELKRNREDQDWIWKEQDRTAEELKRNREDQDWIWKEQDRTAKKNKEQLDFDEKQRKLAGYDKVAQTMIALFPPGHPGIALIEGTRDSNPEKLLDNAFRDDIASMVPEKDKGPSLTESEQQKILAEKRDYVPLELGVMGKNGSMEYLGIGPHARGAETIPAIADSLAVAKEYNSLIKQEPGAKIEEEGGKIFVTGISMKRARQIHDRAVENVKNEPDITKKDKRSAYEKVFATDVTPSFDSSSVEGADEPAVELQGPPMADPEINTNNVLYTIKQAGDPLMVLRNAFIAHQYDPKWINVDWGAIVQSIPGADTLTIY